eukprot:COSAG04_NODE_8327_length_990_cov_0.978676_1_plen_173_part_10
MGQCRRLPHNMSQPPAKRHKPAPRRSSRLQPRAAEPSASNSSASSASAAGGATAAIAAAMPPPVAAAAALDAQLAPLKGQRQDELKRKRAEFEADIARKRAALTRELAQFKRQHAEEQRQLERQIAPLRNELDEVGGYLELVAERPSPVPAWLPADAPPSALLAAQRRLAMAS